MKFVAGNSGSGKDLQQRTTGKGWRLGGATLLQVGMLKGANNSGDNYMRVLNEYHLPKRKRDLNE